MSSILKALKKLEEEKVARLSGQVEISRAILTEKTSQTRHRFSILTIGSLLFLALVVLGGGVTLWRSRGAPPSAPSQANAPQLPPQPAPAVASPSIRPATSPSTTVPAAPAPLATRKPAAAVPPRLPLQVPREQAPPTPQPETPVSPLAKPVPAPIPTPQTPVETMARPAPVPAAPQPQAVPALRVSGIAWQKDGASRLAIVNGQPVGLGAAVDGATVDEIFPDRVRFAFKGENFEVGLGRSSKGE